MNEINLENLVSLLEALSISCACCPIQCGDTYNCRENIKDYLTKKEN